MLTEKIKVLFQFVDFLHSQIDFLLSKQELIVETNELLEKRWSINPNDNYKTKIEYDAINDKFCRNFDTLEELITIPFKQKIKELNIANIGNVSTYINATNDLLDLTRNFNQTDIDAVNNARTKYIEFRSQTNKYHCGMPEFFNELDITLNRLFKFFSDNNFPALEIFKAETTEVQNIGDAVRLIQKGYNGTIQLNHHTMQNGMHATTNGSNNNLKYQAEKKTLDKPTFSVLEWATIFYYADQAKLLPADSILKNRITEFMREYQIPTSFNYFKGRYYNAIKRINEDQDFPIGKLRFVMPFIKKTYKLAVTNIENDILLLEEEKKEY